MSSIVMSAEFLAKAKSAKSFEELKSFVAAEGVEVADDELMAKWTELSSGAKKFKLSEEELDNVAGGCGDPEEYQVQGGWSPVCNGEFKEWGGNRLYYKPVGNCCGNCRYFYPDNENDYSQAGVCRREFSD